MKAFVVPAACAVLLSMPALAQDPTGVETIQAPLLGSKGEQIGQVTVRGSATATVARIVINPGSLPAGWHGIHFHAVGDCSDHGQFQLSKGHVNHLVKKHGLLNPEGPDEGDLPNIMVNADGSARAEVSSLSIRILGQNGLRDGDGSALVIHAAEDDHTSQPIGNAGARIACAVLK
jgi:superoxide dismutase, Cu-Zn family